MEDLTETPDGLSVLIRRSKTDQEGQGAEVPILRGTRLRPVAATRRGRSRRRVAGPVGRLRRPWCVRDSRLPNTAAGGAGAGGGGAASAARIPGSASGGGAPGERQDKDRADVPALAPDQQDNRLAGIRRHPPGGVGDSFGPAAPNLTAEAAVFAEQGGRPTTRLNVRWKP